MKKIKRAVKRAAKHARKPKPKPNDAIAEAIRLTGGTESHLATATGFSQVAINKAKRGRCSLHLALAIHHATRVPLHRIRPDVWREGNKFKPRTSAAA